MKKHAWIILGVVAVVALTACQAMSPEQKKDVLEFAKGELDAGRITQSRFDQIASSLEGGREWISDVVNIGLAVAGSLLGVRVWRGGTMNRTGVAPKPAS